MLPSSPLFSAHSAFSAKLCVKSFFFPIGVDKCNARQKGIVTFLHFSFAITARCPSSAQQNL